MPGAGLRRTRSRDAALEEAFDAAFRALDPGHARRSPATWSWRTEQVPSGAPFVTLRSQEGAVLAHYGALAQGLLVDGQRLLAGQAVDTFAAAELPRRRRAVAFQEARRLRGSLSPWHADYALAATSFAEGDFAKNRSPGANSPPPEDAEAADFPRAGRTHAGSRRSVPCHSHVMAETLTDSASSSPPSPPTASIARRT